MALIHAVSRAWRRERGLWIALLIGGAIPTVVLLVAYASLTRHGHRAESFDWLLPYLIPVVAPVGASFGVVVYALSGHVRRFLSRHGPSPAEIERSSQSARTLSFAAALLAITITVVMVTIAQTAAMVVGGG